MKILAVSGSLRAGSFNTDLLRAAAEAAPEDVEVELFEPSLIADLPLYDQDLDGGDVAEPVQRLRDEWGSADAILFATPEYNGSVPGGLKNAIDWASRPPDQPFAGKPVAMMGASMGLFGTGRAQYHLRQTCVYLDMIPLNKPEVMIPQAQNKFDAQGHLTDAATLKFIQELMVALAAWIRRLKA